MQNKTAQTLPGSIDQGMAKRPWKRGVLASAVALTMLGVSLEAQALALGQSVHIAGYTLSANLAQGLGDARLTPPTAGPAGRLVWLEVSSTQPPQLPPASAKPLAAWRGAGWRVQAQAVNGPAFWQTVGTDDAPALIAATLAALTDIPPP